MSDPRLIPDVAIGTAGVSAPLWVTLIQNGIGWYVLIMGAALITLRVINAYRDLKRKKSDGSTDPS